MIYLFILSLLIICILLDHLLDKKAKTMIYVIECVTLILFMGLRYQVGGDSIRYEYNHAFRSTLASLKEINIWIQDSQPGWLYLSALSKEITNSFFLLQFVVCAFVNSSFFYIAYKKCNNPITFILLYFLTQYMYFSTEILRESMAVAIFMFSLKFLFDRKFVMYYAICFLAFCFHTSASFTFIFPLFYFIFSTLKGYKSFLVIVALMFGFFFSSDYILNYLSYNFIFDNSFTQDKIIEVSESGKLNIFGFLYSLFFTTPIFFVFYAANKNEETRNDNRNFIILMYLMTNLIGCVVIPFARFSNYFAILFLITLTNIIHKEQDSNFSKAFMCFAVLTMLLGKTLYYTADAPGSSVYHQKRYQKYIPYSSILDPQENSERVNAALKEFKGY